MNKITAVLCAVCFFAPALSAAEGNEVLAPTNTKVAVREHPKTGKPYVTIVGPEGPSRNNPLSAPVKVISRPDYRMLDPKVKSGEIPYDGPVSDRKKVYALAGTLAVTGVVSGVAVAAAAPAATGAAAGGAGIYGAAGAAVITGTASGVWLKSRPTKEERENFDFKSSSKEIKEARTVAKSFEAPVQPPDRKAP